jgi:drug/metabolite transporter (DMT)-like permease
VLSCFIGVFFLNEELTTKKLLGILIVLAGAAVILMRSKINHNPAESAKH